MATRKKLEDIKADLMQVKDLDSLKKEFNKLKQELSKIDFKKEFTAETNRRLKQAEKSYAQMGREFSKLQKQVDQEIERTMTFLKKAKVEAKKSVKKVAQTAEAERKRVAKELKKVSFKKKTTRKKKTKKKITKKTTARKKKA